MNKLTSLRENRDINSFFRAFYHPFTQSNWVQRLWLFLLLAIIPIANFIDVLIIRGWRKAYVYRLGWNKEDFVPEPKDTFKFLVDGIILWITTALYAIVPVVVVRFLGWEGFMDLLDDLDKAFQILLKAFSDFDHIKDHIYEFWALILNEAMEKFFVLLLKNAWIFIYIPLYRVAMIRYSLTDNWMASHFAIGKNIVFLFRNIIDMLYLLAYKIGSNVILALVFIILAATGFGLVLFFILLGFLSYWTLGYHYGLLARLMVEQEGMIEPS